MRCRLPILTPSGAPQFLPSWLRLTLRLKLRLLRCCFPAARSADSACCWTGSAYCWKCLLQTGKQSRWARGPPCCPAGSERSIIRLRNGGDGDMNGVSLWGFQEDLRRIADRWKHYASILTRMLNWLKQGSDNLPSGRLFIFQNS